MKNIGFITGMTALSLTALLSFSPALASEDRPVAENQVAEVVSEAAPAVEQEIFAAAAATSTLNLNVNLGAGLLVQLPLTLDTQAYKDQVIQQIKDLRGKAWDDTSLPFQPLEGSKGKMSLQAYLKSIGITSKAQYQNMVKWDANLERTAIQRLYETNVYWNYKRPNKTDNYTATNGSLSLNGENLYGASGASAAIEAWSTAPNLAAENKSDWDWLKAKKGEWGLYQGHLWNILNPEVKSFALASAGSSTVLSMSPDTPKNQNGLNYKGTYQGQLTLDTKYLSSYAISSSKTLVKGQTAQATASATQYLKPTWRDYYLKSTTLVGSWTSSDSSVIRIDANGKITAVGNGTATIKFTPTILDANGNKKASATTLSQTITVNSPRFTDVAPSNQFYQEIEWMAQQGITTGYPDGTYRPLDNVERGAMAAFFYRMAGSPSYTPPKSSPFKDVPTSHQFYKEIAWMASQKITTGYPDGTFRPSDPVNRDAMAAFFHRFSKSSETSTPTKNVFTDVAANHQFASDILWMSQKGITTGYPDGSYRPSDPVHRDAMAAFFYRYSKL